MTRRAKLVLGVVAAILAPLFIVPYFSPWSRIRNKEIRINIDTGQTRTVVHIYGIPIYSALNDTPLSRELQADPLPDRGEWRPVHTFGPYVRHSPHHNFHSALGQTARLAQIIRDNEMTEEQRRTLALGLVRAWQESGSDDAAQAFLDQYREGVPGGR